MKKITYFIAITALAFTSCKSKKTALEFAAPGPNQAVLKGSPVQLKLKFESVTMDSVAYFVDDRHVGSSTDTAAITVDTKDMAYGPRNISALVYSGGQSDSVSSTFFIVPAAAKNYGFEVVNKYPHDTTAFTQGLQFADGVLYESNGRYGESNLRKVDLKTGKVLKEIKFDEKTFAEGMTLVGNKLFMLTWQQGEGYVFDKNTFAKESSFKYENSKEGWGITYDGKRLIKSDGSNKLYFLDATTGKELHAIAVYDENGPVDELNELEYIDGKVYANVYQKDIIVIIDPETGAVEGRINLVGIYEHTSAYDNELNGIAYDQANKRLFVTGKLWNTLFEIKAIEQ
ncbi:glutaminyl-peptide cyclotransferase [Sphingobacterium thalpophilum]|uniref:Glutamine cyclotransferase n=1 Tax=Sphingobacterium thalpophilum TaxID=259 RepID=A0A4U9UY79_9SPHI|nr:MULTISPECIES: glutaminyl-peptide cyclotransferase [Sphingobacterium]MCW8312469.1 glutaminyl-peptide cyclotransferase [Sphingobacterium sp. InxBP1]VTR37339.1 Glutamine cyclotransferase [Sphingobacterium thalpophilum]